MDKSEVTISFSIKFIQVIKRVTGLLNIGLFLLISYALTFKQ